jgi:predicted transposase YdaD
MKTDSLFYELFKAHPASLFELAGIEPDGEYVFESITVKSTEKRMDGFFRSTDGSGHNIFLEVQGYDDRMIYWRFLREISAYYEQTKSGQPFTAIVLFIDEKYDPKNCPITDFNHPNLFISLYLPGCLKIIGDKASPLTVFKPIVLEKKKLLPEAVPKWKNEIDSLNLSESMNKVLIDLLENGILSRFPKLTLEEIKKMIRLTPLDKTVAGQELIQMGIDEGVLRGLEKGRIEGIEKGIEKGKIIGKIHATQRFLKRRVTSDKKLLTQSPKELRAILKKLETELRIV